MLTIQRASAGSGKTYTLTKTYILLLISIKDPEHGLRLRTDSELADAVQHILAVTFTNKATNEMKERIINELDLLAHPRPDKKSPYLKEFTDQLKVDEKAIREACLEALHQLLYEYQDFNVSTIDSYFQTILRTFSYESDLPDNFQVIIDNDYISRAAVGGMLDDMEHGNREGNKEEGYWVRRLMKNNLESGSKGWNIFQRSSSDRSVFSKVCKMAKDMDKEEYKPVLEALNDYFSSHSGLHDACEEIENLYAKDVEKPLERVRRAARDVINAYESLGEPGELIFGKSNTIKNLNKILSPDFDPYDKIKWPEVAPEGKKLFASGQKAAIYKNAEVVASDVQRMTDAVNALNKYRADSMHDLWALYAKSIPTLALTFYLRKRVEKILQETESVNLSDTNTMLRKIIADGDVPFIYERMGTRLNHFLIDEFQDTSQMQWDNFRPLLRESDSNGYDNLIIGDAKQSIYRFRNAEPKLITHTVGAEFEHIPRGDSEEDNTNWRSFRRIVLFNNFIFRRLSEILGDDIAALYSNTVQKPNAKADLGYAEIDFVPKSDPADPANAESGEAEDESGDRNMLPAEYLKIIGEHVISLLNRGYRQGEIAILVGKNTVGSQVISYLMELNNKLTDGMPPLQMVSEESLALSSSSAVNAVMECFRTIEKGIRGIKESSSDTATGKRLQWREIADHYRFVASENPGLSLEERVKECLKFEPVYDSIAETMNHMQAVTLPSLTEALIGLFVDEENRHRQAPFLAALQDAVLDYCEIYPTDVASLVRWWDSTGKYISISSPEGTDAINVMTIHKSKGLEFPCVIMPDADANFKFKSELAWVDIDPAFPYKSHLPAKLPIEISRKVIGTSYQELYSGLQYLQHMDSINRLYVGMTRAIAELYVILPMPKDQTKSDSKKKDSDEFLRFSDYCMQICSESRDCDEKYVADPSEIECRDLDGTMTAFCYGSPVADIADSLKKYREDNKGNADAIVLVDYYVNNDNINMQYQPDQNDGHPTEDIDEDRLDPRSRGNILHLALEHVEVPDDLPKSMKRLKTRGFITPEESEKYGKLLETAIASVSDRHWFDDTYKVLNERNLLKSGYKLNRPDRMMISADGKEAIVVDYKFATSDSISYHRRQVRRYMRLLDEALPDAEIKGFIWYIDEDRIVPVEMSDGDDIPSKADEKN